MRSKEAKNLDTMAEKKTAVREESQMIQDIKGKIVELSWKLKKDGYKDTTIKPTV